MWLAIDFAMIQPKLSHYHFRACIQLGGVCQRTEQSQKRNSVLSSGAWCYFGDSQISCRVIHGQSALRRPTMQRFGLRDDQWERIKDLLPGREGHVGGNAADNRLFVDAVLYRYRTGVPWRDLPARFGDWNIVYQRFNRWAKSGVFDRIFKLLASDADNEYMMIDASIVRAHQHSSGARKKNGPQAIGRSRGGLTTKIHALVDALGNPVELMLTPGQDHDLTCAEPSWLPLQ